MAEETKKLIFDKQTLVPVTMVMTIIGVAFFVATTIAEIKTNQSAIKVDVAEIKLDYVPRAEYQAQMANINDNLKHIKELVSEIKRSQ